MFDIGFAELILIAVLTLIILGPQRMPQAVRSITLWVGRLKNSFNRIGDEIKREVGADEIMRQLHNERIMKDLEGDGSSFTRSTELKKNQSSKKTESVDTPKDDKASSKNEQD